jgi:hypothetical protein
MFIRIPAPGRCPRNRIINRLDLEKPLCSRFKHQLNINCAPPARSENGAAVMYAIYTTKGAGGRWRDSLWGGVSHRFGS